MSYDNFLKQTRQKSLEAIWSESQYRPPHHHSTWKETALLVNEGIPVAGKAGILKSGACY
jgi:hypothetical protein